MGKSAPSAQTVTNKTELPQWVQEAGQKNLAAAYDVSANMIGPYEGQRVAGITPATENIVGNITQNAAMSQPAFAYAQQLAAQAGGYQPMQVQAGYATPQVQTAPSSPQVQAGQLSQTDLAQYMNPYTKSVLETSLDVLNQQRQTGLNQAYDAAIKAKAFGGSRQAIQEGVVNAAAQQQAGQLAAQLMAQNYGQAQSAAQADITRAMEAQRLNQATASGDLGRILEAQRLNQLAASGDITRAMEAQRLNQQAGLSGAQLGIQGASTLGQLAGTGQEAYLTGQTGALTAQSLLQAQQQAQLDAAQQAYREAQQFPIQQLQIPIQALGATPYGSTKTETGPGMQSSPLLSGLGAASSAVSIMAGLASL
jgi:hypothetical protein